MLKRKLAIIGSIFILLFAITVNSYSFTAGDFIGNVHYQGGGFIGTNSASNPSLNATVSISENLPPYNITIENMQYGQGIYYLTWLNGTITTAALILEPFNFNVSSGIEWIKAIWD